MRYKVQGCIPALSPWSRAIVDCSGGNTLQPYYARSMCAHATRDQHSSSLHYSTVHSSETLPFLSSWRGCIAMTGAPGASTEPAAGHWLMRRRDW